MIKRIFEQAGLNLVLIGATVGALWVVKDFAFMENFHFPSAFIAIGIMALLNTFRTKV